MPLLTISGFLPYFRNQIRKPKYFYFHSAPYKLIEMKKTEKLHTYLFWLSYSENMAKLEVFLWNFSLSKPLKIVSCGASLRHVCTTKQSKYKWASFLLKKTFLKNKNIFLKLTKYTFGDIFKFICIFKRVVYKRSF